MKKGVGKEVGANHHFAPTPLLRNGCKINKIGCAPTKKWVFPNTGHVAMGLQRAGRGPT